VYGTAQTEDLYWRRGTAVIDRGEGFDARQPYLLPPGVTPVALPQATKVEVERSNCHRWGCALARPHPASPPDRAWSFITCARSRRIGAKVLHQPAGAPSQ